MATPTPREDAVKQWLKLEAKHLQRPKKRSLKEI